MGRDEVEEEEGESDSEPQVGERLELGGQRSGFWAQGEHNTRQYEAMLSDSAVTREADRPSASLETTTHARDAHESVEVASLAHEACAARVQLSLDTA